MHPLRTLVTVTGVAAAAFASAQSGWTIRALPTLGGTDTYAHSINARGDVAGEATLADGSVRAVVWTSDGRTADLGSLSGTSQAKAWKINDKGQVAGYSIDGNGVATATFWDADGAHSIGTLGGTNSRAFSLNNLGQVVGTSDYTYGGRAFSWTLDGGIVDRGNLNPDYRLAFGGANDINDDGTFVGTMYNLFDPFRAVMAGPGEKVRDIALAGRTDSEALAINNSGVMVGYSTIGLNPEHAVIFDGRGGVTDLGTPTGMDQSQATALNDLGWVVGSAFSSADGSQSSFLYKDGQISDLASLVPTSGWDQLYSASGINANGQIVGTGLLGGVSRAFVMTPVPEPTTCVALGLGALLLRRRSRRS